jgi:3-deoxy-manno-octulosonate cytidylyltransferase (CMP-KDO synthetase)
VNFWWAQPQAQRFDVTFIVHPETSSDGHSRASGAPVSIVIPARYDSTRFPGKALADIGGLPMIVHVMRSAAAARGVSSVIVATDDQRIRDAVERFDGTAVLTRSDHRSGTDRVAEVAASLDAELIVNLQGDEPLVPPGMIEEVIAPLQTGARMSTLRRLITDRAELTNPNVVKVVVDGHDDALYFSRFPIPFVRDGESGVAHKHIGIYGYRRDFLLEFAALPPTPLELAESLEQLRALEHGIRIRTPRTVHDSIGVDTPEDLERVRRLHDRAAAAART